MKLKIVLPVLFPMLMLFGAWVAGFDFSERGRTALFVYFLAVWSCAIGVFVANSVESLNQLKGK
ncbi:hypothetical protein [Undibacterium sp.]|uniref:hypothetical protein n=1 Tax=Undibacterium sp. TaxID=1914977 RepID=UPI00374FDEDC